MRLATALLFASLVVGCANSAIAPRAVPEPWLAWQAPLGREDALVGRILDTEQRRFVTPADVLSRARGSAFVLLGEKHDNPDHHRLQAWLVESLAAAGRRPAVVFEMIPRDRAAVLEAAIAAHPDDPDALAVALDWAHGGWPDFALYRPIFAAALAARLAIVPGDLARAQLAQMRLRSLDALPPAERARLALEPPPSDEARRAFADEVREAHCGMAPEAMVDAMIAVQRARDATLADALLGSGESDGGVLIAGTGHVRRDRGVPLYLARREPQRRVLTLAFSEVPAGSVESKQDPSLRAAEFGTEFDLIWFTPRVDDEDPCERFKHELEKMRAPKPAPQARWRSGYTARVAAVPAFRLLDTDARAHVWPSGRARLLVFAHAGCPTCELTLPIVEAAHEAFGTVLDVAIVSQDDDGGRALREKHGLRTPFLDDSALTVSFGAEIDAVPTTVLLDAGGEELARYVGFAREDWRALFERMAQLAGTPAPARDWSRLPELRPGCGSRTNDPEVAARFEARASSSPMRARRIELGDADDPFEFLFDQGLTDGLPVVPPTPERVMRMLEGTRRAAQDVVAEVAPNYAPATVEKIAINAVMAGCKPAYLPVVIAAVEAICTPEFNLHGVLATTFFPTPVLIVNGPIRARIGMNSGINCLGQGNRANATIGRAVQLVVRNLGGGRPGEVDRAALGQPGKFTMCFAENEERSDWAPLHVERGFAREQSTVTAFAGGAPNGFIDQLSRDARGLATSYGLVLQAANHPKHYLHGEIVVVVPPEHVDTFKRDAFTKDQLRARIQEVTSRPLRELLRDDVCAEGLPDELLAKLGAEARVPKFRTPGDITLVVAGGEAGKFGAYFQGWVSGPLGSVMTTRAIETDEGSSG